MFVVFFLGEDRIHVLSETWDHFFTETLPTLQAIFYPVQVNLVKYKLNRAEKNISNLPYN